MSLGNRVLAALAMAAMVIAADGCVTQPPPVAESIVAGSSSAAAGAGGAAVEAGATDGGIAAATTGGGAAGTPTSTPSHTADERRAALDKQFDDSLDAFDARLRQEQQKIAQDRDARQATIAATTTSDSAPEDGGAGAAQPSDAAGMASAQAAPSGPHDGKWVKARTERAGDLKSDNSAGVSTNVAGNGASANVVPDGNDDDIVARRLRKAAEQETDPELKDKLWKEYVEYKKNTQVR